MRVTNCARFDDRASIQSFRHIVRRLSLPAERKRRGGSSRRRPARGTARHAPAHPSRGARGRRRRSHGEHAVQLGVDRGSAPPRDSTARLSGIPDAAAAAEALFETPLPGRAETRGRGVGRRSCAPTSVAPRRRSLKNSLTSSAPHDLPRPPLSQVPDGEGFHRCGAFPDAAPDADGGASRVRHHAHPPVLHAQGEVHADELEREAAPHLGRLPARGRHPPVLLRPAQRSVRQGPLQARARATQHRRATSSTRSPRITSSS